jgi:hypothetical protein
MPMACYLHPRTSGGSTSLPSLSYTPVNSGYVNPCAEYAHESFFERNFVHDFFTQHIPHGMSDVKSGRPSRFGIGLALMEVDTTILIREYKGKRSSLIDLVVPKKLDVHELVLRSYAVSGPPEELWTVNSWTLKTSFYPAIAEAETDITMLLKGLMRGVSLERPPEFSQLAGRIAARATGGDAEDEDEDEWADRLADELSSMTD